MEILDATLIVLAGVAAGAINAVVGSGTMVTFPTLVALGYPPIVATMTNAIGLVPGSAAGSWGYRRELRGQRRLVLTLVPASLVGAVVGASLLLSLPASAFDTIVPVLIALSLLVVVLQPSIQRAVRRRRSGAAPDAPPWRAPTPVLVFPVLLVGVYGGYFAAAQGILLLGILGVLLSETLQRINAVKNVLAGAVNAVAATMYTIVAFDEIVWAAAGLIALGTVVGGALGARYGRLLPPAALRGVIVVLGVVALVVVLG